MAMAYIRETQLGWPLLVDRERTLYAAYGMLQGAAWDIYGPAAIWSYLKLVGRGRRLHRPGSDVTQLGGDVLVDREGLVRVHHVATGPADRPEVSELLAEVR